jgi:hypothetical protein
MKRFLAIALSVFVLAACKKEDKTNASNGTDYTSIRQYDVNGIYLGNLNDASDDYTQEKWPDWVYNGFAPLDTVNLTGYHTSEITVDRLYPNPCKDTQTLAYFATAPINLKLMLMDKSKQVRYLRSVHLFNGKNSVGISYKDLLLAPGYYRLFYGMSAENNPFFMRGHIDILIN